MAPTVLQIGIAAITAAMPFFVLGCDNSEKVDVGGPVRIREPAAAPAPPPTPPPELGRTPPPPPEEPPPPPEEPLLPVDAGSGVGVRGEGQAGVGAGGAIKTDYPTIGHGSPTGEGYGVAGGGKVRQTKPSEVKIGQPTTQGSLDKAIIRRIIRSQLSKITYCYEKQLLTKPGLQGTVTSSFVISAEGAVTSSTASGMDDAVASCVATVIKDVGFPRPTGGGEVTVRYPFVFRPPS